MLILLQGSLLINLVNKSKFVDLEGLNLKIDSTVLLDEPLSKYTTFRIGGPAKYFIIPSDKEDLEKVLIYSNEHAIPLFVLGGGSNVLARDSGFPGIIVSLGGNFFKDISIDNDLIRAGAGARLSRLIDLSIKSNLSGLEFLSGIPGTVGGAVFMNAGSSEKWIGDFIEKVVAIDLSGKTVELKNNDLLFEYRRSNLHEYVIIDVYLTLNEGEQLRSKKICEEFINEKRSNQELSLASAGCVFKNPSGYSAGKLIDEAGLKGFNVNDAVVSTKHANFIVNRSNANASDVFRLIDEIKVRVKRSSGFDLELELKIL